MQDRAMGVGLFLVLGICCIGAYVAVSGFMLSGPKKVDLSFLSALETPNATAQPTFAFPTTTPAPPTQTSGPTASPTRTLTPTITPKGFKPSATPAQAPTDTPLAQVTFSVTQVPASVPAAATAPPPAASSGCGFEYCSQPGPPDAVLAPTGKACPESYLWGVVLDKNGNGIGGAQGWKITYTDKDNTNYPPVPLKTKPDPEGKWDIPIGAGSWTLRLLTADGRPLSPPVQVSARQPSVGGNCGTRIDFKQVK